MRKTISPLRDFLKRESSSGVLVLSAALLGLLTANSFLSNLYQSVLNWHFEIGTESIYLKLSILKVINYILMTVFFFVVGLEIKRELTSGNLTSVKKAALPLIAAVGGMTVPALVYLFIAGGVASNGWGVAVATDIALAVGLLSIVGRSVSSGLKTFLLALAVIDDIGAILVIALIYSGGINRNWTLASILIVGVIHLLKKVRVERLFIYVIFGVILWYCTYRSGVHPTLTGVILGLMTPNIPRRNTGLTDIEDHSISLIEWLEHRIHPISAFVIVPLFAFANAGVALNAQILDSALSSKIAWGIFLGLFLGKPVGIFLFSILATQLRAAELPENSHRKEILAAGSAAGIGFTVAIFIANLAFDDRATQEIAIISVVAASLLSGLLSSFLFRLLRR